MLDGKPRIALDDMLRHGWGGAHWCPVEICWTGRMALILLGSK
jgi:hypothetical protein